MIESANECENGYSLLVIRFDIQFEEYEPPGFPGEDMFSKLGNLFDSTDVYIIVYAAKNGRRRRILQHNTTTTTEETLETEGEEEKGDDVDVDVDVDDGVDNYYEKTLSMEEAYKLSQKGLRKCVPNDVCLMVGISKLRPNDYSVTMYNTNNLLLDNNNSTNATIIHTSINNNNDNGNNVTSISGVSYRDGKTFPYFLGSDFITFTEVEGTEGTCLLSCPSPNQSLLEFDYWTGEVVTSPFWIVTTAEDDTGMASDDSIFLDHNIDRTIVGGCSYNCNYPQQRLIHESICLDHTTTNVNSATSSTNTNTNVDNNNNNNNNNSAKDDDNGDDDASTIVCYEFFLATNNHFDPLSYISPSFRLRYNGIVLRDEISFQFISVPLGPTDNNNNNNNICVQSYNCQNKDMNSQQQQHIPFDFFLYRPYSKKKLNWELRDRVVYGNGDDNFSMILNGTLPPTHTCNSTRDLTLTNQKQTECVDYYAYEEDFYSETSISNETNRRQQRRNSWQKQYHYDYEGDRNFNNEEISKALPIHVHKCIPIARVRCLSFQISIDEELNEDVENSDNVNENFTKTTEVIKITSFESDPYQIKLNDVTYRHAYYWLGEEQPINEYHLRTGSTWHAQYEMTLMGRSCNDPMINDSNLDAADSSAVVQSNKSDFDNSSSNSNSSNPTTGTATTTTTTTNGYINNVCNPANESLFQFDFHTIKNASSIDKSTNFNDFDFELVGHWWDDYWNRIHYVRDQDYFGNTYLFDEAYSVVQCVPKDYCLGLDLMYDVGGEGFPIINSTYKVSQNGVFLEYHKRSAELRVSDYVWTTPYGCTDSTEATSSSKLSVKNNVDFSVIITMFAIIAYLLFV